MEGSCTTGRNPRESFRERAETCGVIETRAYIWGLEGKDGLQTELFHVKHTIGSRGGLCLGNVSRETMVVVRAGSLRLSLASVLPNTPRPRFATVRTGDGGIGTTDRNRLFAPPHQNRRRDFR